MIKSKLDQQHEHDMDKDIGKNLKLPSGCGKIHAHWAFGMKHDGRGKALLEDNGGLTEAPFSSACQYILSLRGIRLVFFLAKFNELELRGTSIGSACLETKIKDNVCVIAGLEFGELQGHILLTRK